MPLYEYECPFCMSITELVCKIADMPDFSSCEQCGTQAHKIISRVANMRADWDSYIDENLGDGPIEVRGRGHRKKLMKAQGLEEKDMSGTQKKEVLQKLKHMARTKDLSMRKGAQAKGA